MLKNQRKLQALTRCAFTVLFSMLLINISYAQDASQTLSKTPPHEIQQPNTTDLEKKITALQQSLTAQKESADKEIAKLETLVESQKNSISGLELQLNSLTSKPLTNGTTFEVWSGIALAVAAIVLTGVAVVVGIGSFWGYREIKDGATRSAKETAEKTVEKLVPLAVAEKTEEEMFRLIDNGRLDAVVDEIMQKIIYKDVAFEDDLPSE